jgi:hypothetical protein
LHLSHIPSETLDRLVGSGSVVFCFLNQAIPRSS